MLTITRLFRLNLYHTYKYIFNKCIIDSFTEIFLFTVIMRQYLREQMLPYI
jgi:hypothetical protein